MGTGEAILLDGAVDAAAQRPVEVRRGLVAVWAAGFRADRALYTPPSRLLRVLRRSRVLGLGTLLDELITLDPYRHHVAADGLGDPLFFVSHRHYLAQGLSVRARAAAALAHYRHEAARHDQAYHDLVHRGAGLVLWRDAAAGVVYDIVLSRGADVAHEGGLSLTLRVGGQRVSVLSFSFVPEWVVRPSRAASQATVLFITRNHQRQNHDWQAAFYRAFGRNAPARLCIAALSGLAEAEGIDTAVGLRGDLQPSCSPAQRDQFAQAYCDFWQTLGGQADVAGDPGYVMPMPLPFRPLDGLPSAKRARALQRRQHLIAVQAAARDVILSHRLA